MTLSLCSKSANSLRADAAKLFRRVGDSRRKISREYAVRVLTLAFAFFAFGAAASSGAAANSDGAMGGGLLEFLASGGHGAQSFAVGATAPRVLGAAYAAPSVEPRAPVVMVAPKVAALAPPGTEPSQEIPEQFRRQEVAYDGPEPPGVIVIDTPHKFLYLVESGGRALRYGIGVGRPGFEWAGVKTISRKAEWPDWTPPAEMLLRRPDLPRHMDGGIDNCRDTQAFSGRPNRRHPRERWESVSALARLLFAARPGAGQVSAGAPGLIDSARGSLCRWSR